MSPSKAVGFASCFRWNGKIKKISYQKNETQLLLQAEGYLRFGYSFKFSLSSVCKRLDFILRCVGLLCTENFAVCGAVLSVGSK